MVVIIVLNLLYVANIHKTEGGLGLLDLRLWNKALFIKNTIEYP